MQNSAAKRLSRPSGQEAPFCPALFDCPTGTETGKTILGKPRKARCPAWDKDRDKSQSCPGVPAFPFLRREGPGHATGTGQIKTTTAKSN